MISPNASSLELTWTAIAIGGAGVAVVLLIQIFASYLAIIAWIKAGRLIWWGPRHKFALGFIIGISLLLAVWCGFIALGANSMLNPPPATPDRAASSERGGWILVLLEAVLFAFQCILTWAWGAVAKPTLNPQKAPHTLASLIFEVVDVAREMGHTVANELSFPVALLDAMATDPAISEQMRVDAATALNHLLRVREHVHQLHVEIKALEPTP